MKFIDGLALIIKESMHLEEDQIAIGDFGNIVKDDGRLYVLLNHQLSTPFANNRYFDGQEYKSYVNMIEVINITIYAYNQEDGYNQAMERKEGMLQALSSFKASEIARINNFRIYPITESIVDVSSVESNVNVKRYDVLAKGMACYL